MSDAEKQQRIAAIDQQLDELAELEKSVGPATQ
jgi:hypothetical protein